MGVTTPFLTENPHLCILPPISRIIYANFNTISEDRSDRGRLICTVLSDGSMRFGRLSGRLENMSLTACHIWYGQMSNVDSLR